MRTAASPAPLDLIHGIPCLSMTFWGEFKPCLQVLEASRIAQGQVFRTNKTSMLLLLLLSLFIGSFTY